MGDRSAEIQRSIFVPRHRTSTTVGMILGHSRPTNRWDEEQDERDELADSADVVELDEFGEPTLKGSRTGNGVKPALNPGLDYDLSPQPYRAPPKVGRNDPCLCGSGKKHKKCCGA